MKEVLDTARCDCRDKHTLENGKDGEAFFLGFCEKVPGRSGVPQVDEDEEATIKQVGGDAGKPDEGSSIDRKTRGVGQFKKKRVSREYKRGGRNCDDDHRLILPDSCSSFLVDFQKPFEHSIIMAPLPSETALCNFEGKVQPAFQPQDMTFAPYSLQKQHFGHILKLSDKGQNSPDLTHDNSQ